MDHELTAVLSALPLPTLICENRAGLPVLYGNDKATLLFLALAEGLTQELKGRPLRELLEAEGGRCFDRLTEGAGNTVEWPVRLARPGGRGNKLFLTLSLLRNGTVLACLLPRESAGVGLEIIHSMQLNEGAEKAIASVLEVAGTWAGVSRAYIFEELTPTTIHNTYEWCAPGVAPVIQTLQNQEKRAYNNQDLAVSGRFVLEDVRSLPSGDREILERQGIKAMVALTLYKGQKLIGYVGFDDCDGARYWEGEELRLLETISTLLGALLSRRDSEKKTRLTLEILQLMSDNSDDYVYVRDLEDGTVKFVSKATCDMLGKSLGELLGQPCHQVVRFSKEGRCSHCPIGKINWRPGQSRSDTYTWECYSDRLEKNLLFRSSIITWVDGRPSYLARAIDITEQIDVQKKLRFYATMDMLLGIYNRRWGEQLLLKKIREPEVGGSLCFVDVDGLKRVNDTLGHQAGDQLLRETVTLLQAHLPGNEIICRWGGDEFLIWVPAPVEELEHLFRHITGEAKRISGKDGRAFPLSFSYGIIPFVSGEEASLSAMVTVADRKMYEQKLRKRSERFN